jgi:hypothetical protein
VPLPPNGFSPLFYPRNGRDGRLKKINGHTFLQKTVFRFQRKSSFFESGSSGKICRSGVRNFIIPPFASINPASQRQRFVIRKFPRSKRKKGSGAPAHNGNDSSSESFPGQKEKRDQEPRLTTATIRHAEIRRIAPVPGGLKMPTIWLVLYFEFPYFLFHLLRHKVHHRHGAGVPDAR